MQIICKCTPPLYLSLRKLGTTQVTLNQRMGSQLCGAHAGNTAHSEKVQLLIHPTVWEESQMILLREGAGLPSLYPVCLHLDGILGFQSPVLGLRRGCEPQEGHEGTGCSGGDCRCQGAYPTPHICSTSENCMAKRACQLKDKFENAFSGLAWWHHG